MFFFTTRQGENKTPETLYAAIITSILYVTIFMQLLQKITNDLGWQVNKVLLDKDTEYTVYSFFTYID